MPAIRASAPFPDLRIVPTDCLLPHEAHDSQRALPLIERLRSEEFIINPPVVAPMDDGRFVILDGANRCYAIEQLGYPHALVQAVRYGASVDLGTWQHVVCEWDEDKFIQHLRQMPDVDVHEIPANGRAIATLVFHDGPILTLDARQTGAHERNAALREFVDLYQRNAVLQRTAETDPHQVWQLYRDPVALVSFPGYEPSDIVAAARERAFLPPGISRHIVHGRAIRVNYPIAALKDSRLTLDEKNRQLQAWIRDRVADRHVRYYAESTYQFDE